MYTDLYPPATICVSGHLLAASSNNPFASSIASSDVPAGREFAASVAWYLGPTPWHATFWLRALLRLLQTAGPVEPPRRPCSVEARAKIKVTGWQGPVRSSLPEDEALKKYIWLVRGWDGVKVVFRYSGAARLGLLRLGRRGGGTRV